MTQIESAIRNIKTDLVRRTAGLEGVSAEFVMKGLREGTIVIPANRMRAFKKPCAIGKGLRTKINANIGTSPYYGTPAEELKKLDICIRYKADTVMDLSTGSNLKKVRREIIKNSPLPIGTVPIYEAAVAARLKKKPFYKVSVEDMLSVIEAQAKEGVDFFTIHAGVTRRVLGSLKKSGRVAGIVSRGGALMADWMRRNGRENPLFEEFDRLLSIVKEYDVTLSLGDGLRPGSVCDATDRPQIEELKVLGELARKARRHGVQAMIEGPGHVPINQIETNMILQKRLCDNGADFLCYVTPSEHLSIPTLDDVKEGIMAYRIAAHSADVAKGLRGAIKWDRTISRFRRQRQWSKQIKASMDPEKAASIHKRGRTRTGDVCSMCGEYCPLKITEG
jgi:phosphomethylpyrimidine synthase